jgi:hypothetical protein
MAAWVWGVVFVGALGFGPSVDELLAFRAIEPRGDVYVRSFAVGVASDGSAFTE